jgi:hypothetical protein
MAVVNVPFSTSPTGPTLLTGQSYAVGAGTMAPSFGSQMAEAFVTAGPIVSIFGAVNSAIGAYYSAESQKNQLKMQAQNQRFQADMSRINARGAAFNAAQITQAGQQQSARYTMQAGQARAGAVASMAGRGIRGGVGSAGEVLGSMDLIKEIDRLTINANTVRQAEAARAQALNYTTQATMSDLSAQNLSSTAGTIYPGLSASTSLLGSAADIGTTWARNRRLEELLGGVSTKRI